MPGQGAPVVETLIDSDGWAGLPAAIGLAEQAAAAAARHCGKRLPAGARISLLLADDARLRELNARWRGQDKPTNVLSFPAALPGQPDGAPLLGDIAIAWETLAAEAREQGKPAGDHLSHLVVHGILHLIGYDHETAAEAEAMEVVERAILAELGIADPYADTILIADGTAKA